MNEWMDRCIMKCGIMTFHRAINYGAVLQAYALKHTIENEYPVTCEIIDYRCQSIEKMYTGSLTSKNPKMVIRSLLSLPKRIKFKKFLKKGLEIGASVQKEQLAEKSEHYDLIITGSDQVWGKSRIGIDHSYFLDFVTDSSKKASYAASMGAGTVSEEHEKQYRKLLQSFRYLSVREHQAKVALEELLQRPVEESIDPTLLMNRDQWKQIVPGRFRGKRYLLIYTLTNSEELMKHARKVAEERKLETYYLTDSYHQEKGVRNLRGLGPEEWVDAFMNASYIVTNSFHGTAFAINFHCDFNAEIPQGLAQRGTRILDLLQLVGLEERLLGNGGATAPIDFAACDACIQEQGRKARAYLRKILQ